MKAKSPEEGKSFVRQARLCDNRFGRGHVAMECRSMMKCQVNGCGWKHHTMLHQGRKRDNNNDITPAATSNPAVPPSIESGASAVSGAGEAGQCNASRTGKNAVSLRIVPVVVKGKGQDNEIVTNALLDSGSDVTLCNVSLLKKLGLEGRPKELSLATVNGTSGDRKGFELSLTVRGLRMNEDVELNRVWTVDTLYLPQSVVPTKEDTAKWPHLNGIEFPKIPSNEVSVLIGSDVPEAHWVNDQRRGRRGQPHAVCTPLGWTLMGPMSSCDSDCFSVNFVRHDDAMLH